MPLSDLHFQRLWQEHSDLAALSVASERHAFFALPVAPAAYQEHAFSLGDSPTEIEGWMGIRFRNLDARAPFVALLTRQDPLPLLQNPVLYQALIAQIHKHYGCFSPHGFTLALAAPSDTEGLDLPPHQVWNQTWATSLQTRPGLAHRPIHLQALTQLSDLDAERFQNQYQFWRLLHPDLAPWVQAANPEELSESMAAGLCFYALSPEGETVGLIAGLPSDDVGQPGVLMLEAFIYPTYQGQGYGKAMQAQFIQHLCTRPHLNMLWGSIHADNIASWRTARACGREIIEQEYFFAL